MTLKVFLPEDSPATRAHLSQVLVNRAEVEIVGVAETERQAIAWLNHNADRWDIALVDLFLEEGTGVGVIAHCRDRHPHQSVVVMTNHSLNDALLLDCKRLGVDALFHKSTQLDKLVAYCIGPATTKSRNAASAPAAEKAAS